MATQTNYRNSVRATRQTQVDQSTIGTYVAHWDTTTTTKSLSSRDAARQFGIGNLGAFQNSFLDTRGMWARYPGYQLQDIKDHPVRYARDVGTLVGAELIGGPVGGLITGVHALHSAYELEKEVH